MGCKGWEGYYKLSLGVLPLHISTHYPAVITSSAKRNTYSVAIPFCINTQGSGLRPQPWAGEAQLLQSCRGAYLQQWTKYINVRGTPSQSTESPIPAFPKGKESLSTALNTGGRSPRPLGRAGEGLRGGWTGFRLAGEGPLVAPLPYLHKKALPPYRHFWRQWRQSPNYLLLCKCCWVISL